MNRTLVFICLTLIYNHVYSQNEKNIWFFGDNAGLNFNSGTPISITGALITDEGCSSIADSNGQLLFYTNGVTVWNSNHQIMQNGTNLGGHISSTQSATIIKKPGSNSIYYIFTLDAELGSNGFRYSLVDISLNSGLGSVIEKNIHIRNFVCEKLVIIKHANNFDFWIIVHGFGGFFYSYLVTADGISTTPFESNVGYALPLANAYAKGMLKASPDGTKIAVTNTIHYQSVELFDFDNTSGELSNEIFLFHGHSFSSCDAFGYYGIEFSPNGNLLYVSNVTCPLIYQFDLTAPDISGSAVEITVPSFWVDFKGALQLGPDNKIYVSIYEKNYLGVINYPNNVGLACDYQQNINLFQDTTTRLGLPISYTFNNLDIIYEIYSDCDSVGVLFSIESPLLIDNVNWEFGDGNTSNLLSPSHQYYNSGTYTVNLTANTNMGILSINKPIYINIINTVELPSMTSLQTFCIENNATLNDIVITGENIKWYDSSINGNELSTSTSLIDGMTYYATQTIDDCESLKVPVTITIQNTAAPQGEPKQTLCINQNPTLNDITFTGENILWYDSLTSTNPLPSSTLLIDGATYFATQTINDCESVNRLTVTVELLETLNASDYTEVVCDVENDNTEIVDLSHYNSNLIQNHSEYSFEYYTSENEALNQIASAMITSYAEYPLNIGWNTIYVRIDSSFGCSNIVRLKLHLVRSPIVAVSDIVALCKGKTLVLNTGPDFDSYLWSTGETSPSITVSQEGEYWVTVSQNHDNVICSTTKQISVTLSTIAEITNIEIQDWTNSDNTVIIHVDGLGDYEYSLDGIFYQDSNVFNNLTSGPYTVYVRDKNQCGIIKDQIYLLSYPKYFTPNGDGIHDNWYINFSYYEPNLKVLIFDRYGKLLKELRQNESWDGKFNGNGMPSNDYWFVVTRDNEKIHKGHFSLKR